MAVRNFKWFFLACGALAQHVTLTPTATARDELLLHFPGTGIKADDAMHVDYINHAASLGFHVIALDYPNEPSINLRTCRMKPGSCYKEQRQERLYGGGAIEEKDAGIPQLKAKLAELESLTEWAGKFYDGNISEPKWLKIVISGHSQGAGMALFVAKTQAVLGVIMLSGGTDNSAKAPWLTDPSATEASRLYGLYHDADGMGKAKELGNAGVVVLNMRGSSYVDDTCCSGAMLHSNDTTFACGSSMEDCQAHYASLDKHFSKAWSYMMKREFNEVGSKKTNDAAPNVTDAGNGDTVQNNETTSGPISRTWYTFGDGISLSIVFAVLSAAWELL